MIAAIHQPNYLPSLRFFEKMRSSDVFVVLDDAQFTRNSFINRNRIRTANRPLWLTVPVRNNGRFGQLIKDVEIDNSQAWARKHWKSIKQNYGKTEAFAVHAEALERIYSRRWEKLFDLNCELIAYIAGQLGIIGHLSVYASSLGIPSAGTERLIDICKQLKADTYLSGSGGRNYQDEQLFEKARINMVYQSGEFSDLSALDDLLSGAVV